MTEDKKRIYLIDGSTMILADLVTNNSPYFIVRTKQAKKAG